MSLVEALSQLQEDLPLALRSAPKRVLLEHCLQREHALLQQSSAPEIANTLDLPQPWHRATHTARDGSTSADAIVSQRAKGVESMFRKARLRRCFQHMVKKQQGGGNHVESQGGLSEVSPHSGISPLVRQPSHIEAVGVSALDEETSKHLDVEREISSERVRSPQPEVLHPRHPDDGPEPIPPRGPMVAEEQPFVDRHAPASRDENDEASERAERRILLRRFFHAARRDERLDLGGVGNSSGPRGAPCFTVGGSGIRPSRGPARREHQGFDGDFVGPGGVGLRRAELLRRILHAMRESVREQALQADPSRAPPPPASSEHLPRPPTLPDSQQLRPQDESSPTDQSGVSPSSTPEQLSTDGPDARRELLPAHPRQTARTAIAYQAVFQALARLLPTTTSSGAEQEQSRGGAGNMQVAAVRCGIQCQGYIRALQRGIQVLRPGVTSGDDNDIPCTLIFQAAKNKAADGSTGATLTLHDLGAPPDAAAGAAAPAGGATIGHTAVTSNDPARRRPSASTFAPPLPLARLTRVMCLPGSGEGESLRFVILAAAGGGPPTGDDPCSGGGSPAGCGRTGGRGGPPVTEEAEPFGILRATSGEDFCALVLGVASVKSALNSPFRMRQAIPSAGQLPGSNPAGSPAPTTTSSAAAAAASSCLPWQGARVCIAELAPTRTFFGAVAAVEAEARRAGRENGITLRDQNLLICTCVQ